MKGMLFIFLACAAFSVFGQGARIHADAFAAYAVATQQVHQQITIQQTAAIVPDVPSSGTIQLAHEDFGHVHPVAGIVVQEELVAGRMIDAQLTDAKKRPGKDKEKMQVSGRQKKSRLLQMKH